jgi:hypothetical protein
MDCSLIHLGWKGLVMGWWKGLVMGWWKGLVMGWWSIHHPLQENAETWQAR